MWHQTWHTQILNVLKHPPLSPPNLEIKAISRVPLDPGWKPKWGVNPPVSDTQKHSHFLAGCKHININTNSCWFNHQNIAKSCQKHGAAPARSIQSQVKHQYSLAKHQQQCLGVSKHQAVVHVLQCVDTKIVLSLFICFPKIKTR